MSNVSRLIALLLFVTGGSVSAQILGGVPLPSVSLPGGLGTGGVTGALDRAVGQPVDQLTQQATPAEVERAISPSLGRVAPENWVPHAPPATLLDLRRLRLAELVKQNRTALEMDGSGNPARRGHLIAVDPSRASVALATRAGFSVRAEENDKILGLRTVMLAPPSPMSGAKALALLRRAAPGIDADFDHVFEPAGGALLASAVALAAGNARSGPVIGMIDGGVGRSPSLANASIEQRGFAGAAQATGHGTAVASLMVGSDGRFAGAARAASLLVGDVYGGNPAAGSATSIVQAMSWIAARRPSVINISLVGPRNALVERAVSLLLARGIKVVAAVGNDGPAAPPLYPASQPGVIAVTGVDAKNRALAEAGRAAHLDYAGPGADMAAALPGRGYARVRGTSFAAPFVTARLAMTGSTVRLDSEVSKGRGRVGRGIVCAACRTPPKQVGAK